MKTTDNTPRVYAQMLNASASRLSRAAERAQTDPASAAEEFRSVSNVVEEIAIRLSQYAGAFEPEAKTPA